MKFDVLMPKDAKITPGRDAIVSAAKSTPAKEFKSGGRVDRELDWAEWYDEKLMEVRRKRKLVMVCTSQWKLLIPTRHFTLQHV